MTAAVAPALDLLETKMALPIVRRGVVERAALVARLAGSDEFRLVSVAAPGGYGKTTALAQWAAEDPRRFAWLTLDERDNDPVLFFRYLLAALETAGVVELSAPTEREAAGSIWLTLVPETCAAISHAATSFVLVLDDVHEARSADLLDALAVVSGSCPPGSQLVLSGRRELTEVVARRRAEGTVFELGPSDLALTRAEAGQLLSAAGVSVDEAAADDLVRHTEGWPAGLYLTTLAFDATGSVPMFDLSDVDRFVDDYLRLEILSRLPDDELSFLTRSSVLERLRADLCDAVLGRQDSRRMLEAIERSNLFLVPLDRERKWYRYHELFRAALRHELDRIDPTAAGDVRRHAADWCETHQLLEDAMSYALAAEDTDRIARLVVALAFPLYRSGRMATAESWLAYFDDAALIERHPAVAALGALLHAFRGRTFQAERWLDAAERAADDTGPLADGSTSVRPWIATVEAMLCRHGPEQMLQEAELAIAELGPLSPLRAPAMWLLATASLLLGSADADGHFEDAAEASRATGATFAGANALAQRALLALGRADLPAAQELIKDARALVASEQFHDYMPMALLLVTQARADIAAGEGARGKRRLAKAQRLRPYLTHAIPFYAVQTLTEMARAYLALGDVNGARAVLSDAADILRHRPQLGFLGEDVAELRRSAAVAGRPDSGWESSLTGAELRLLPLLTTHLSFREIGERLFVSRNTVKTQAISIYRKLAVSSRGDAVARAAELGLLEPPLRT